MKRGSLIDPDPFLGRAVLYRFSISAGVGENNVPVAPILREADLLSLRWLTREQSGAGKHNAGD